MKKNKSLWTIYKNLLTSTWENEKISTRDKIRESWRLLEILVVGGLSVRIPRLIWYHDECEVEILFDNSRISYEKLHKAEEVLAEIGIEFHTHSGNIEPLGTFTGWKWDNSMRGPILVRFKKRGKKGRNDGF